MIVRNRFAPSLLLLIACGLPRMAAAGDLESRDAVCKGSLVICGGGHLPEAVKDRFVELAGGTQARIVVIPTASSLAESPAVETCANLWRERGARVTVLHTRSRHVANDLKFVEPLKQATGVWFMGGVQSRLEQTYVGTAVEEETHKLLARGGVVGGTSAGAAIMTRVMIRSGTPEQAEPGTGLGFLPGAVVDQHFLKRRRMQRLLGMLKDYPGLVGLGIDEATALVVQNRRLTVLGESCVVACLSALAEEDDHMVLKPGDEADLLELRDLAVARAKEAAAADETTEVAGGR
jgi:cyanophycinase